MQHNCASNNCGITNNRQVYQERLRTSTLAPGVEHRNIKNFVLNTAKMRDAQFLQSFSVHATPLDRKEAIYTGAAREVATQQAKSKRSRKQPENTMLQDVLNPLHGTRRGGTLRGRGRGANL